MQSYRRPLPPTPKLIKVLALTSLIFGASSAFFNSLLGLKLGVSFQQLFSLSLPGLKSGYLWQPFTFLFMPQTDGPLSFYFLFTLFFDVYLLWIVGCKVYPLFGTKSTTTLFFMPPCISAIISLVGGHFFHVQGFLFGSSYAMTPLIIAYCFANPVAQMDFLPLQTVRLKWLGLGLVLLYLFQDLSNFNFISLFTHLLVMTTSYLYMVIIHQMKSPFEFMHKLDHFFLLRRNKLHDPSKVVNLYENLENKNRLIDDILSKISQKKKLNLLDRLRLKMLQRKKSKL